MFYFHIEKEGTLHLQLCSVVKMLLPATLGNRDQLITVCSTHIIIIIHFTF